MNRKILNTFIIILILILSIGCGFLYDTLFTRYRLQEYPRKYNDTVISSYYEYSVPVSVIYSAIKVESNYDSGLTGENGEIGLMQLTREEYTALADELGKYKDPGLLYEPATNIDIGTYKLSKLFTKYQSWRTVYAALYIGEEKVDEWLCDPENLDSEGHLSDIPDRETEKYVKDFEKTVEIYLELYGSAN